MLYEFLTVCVAFIPEKPKEVLQTKLMAFSTKNVIIINVCQPIHVHDEDFYHMISNNTYNKVI